MPNTREKLVELLNNSFAEQYEKRGLLTAPHTATDLIAHGVTVQEWIPASEPPKDDLPVLVTCGKGYRPFVARYDLIWKRWRVSHTLKITHWQPLPSTMDLPQPPKGE
jgi:hypothetical protein